MSRIGRKQIKIPEKTEITISADGVVSVKGPKGEISKNFKPEIEIKVEGDIVSLLPKAASLESSALWGTYSSHIQNMIAGVNNPFVKKLILEGIGYKGEVAGENLNLSLGLSHPVKIKIPKGITVLIEKGVFTFTGFDKEVLTSFAAEIRSLKKPEPYKGKGFRYDGEIIKRKQGKKSV